MTRRTSLSTTIFADGQAKGSAWPSPKKRGAWIWSRPNGSNEMFKTLGDLKATVARIVHTDHSKPAPVITTKKDPIAVLSAHRSPIGKDTSLVVAETPDGVFAALVRVAPKKMTLPKMCRLWTSNNGAFSRYDLVTRKFLGPSFLEQVIV